MIKFKVSIPVFVSEVNVVYSTVTEINRYAKLTKTNELSIVIGGSFINGTPMGHIIWINSYYGFNFDTISTIVHESGHCIFKIFEYLNIAVDKKADKHHCFIYCQSYLVNEILTKLHKKVKLKP